VRFPVYTSVSTFVCGLFRSVNTEFCLYGPKYLEYIFLDTLIITDIFAKTLFGQAKSGLAWNRPWIEGSSEEVELGDALGNLPRWERPGGHPGELAETPGELAECDRGIHRRSGASTPSISVLLAEAWQ